MGSLNNFVFLSAGEPFFHPSAFPGAFRNFRYVKTLHRMILFMPGVEILLALPTVRYLPLMFDPFVVLALVCLRFLQCGFRLNQMIWMSALLVESGGIPEQLGEPWKTGIEWEVTAQQCANSDTYIYIYTCI